MNGFELRAEQKKVHIITTSIMMLKKYSPKRVSVRDIAKEANVSVVTIYNYFENKEGLFKEVIRYVLTNQLKIAEDILYSTSSIKEKISRITFNKSTSLNNFHPEFLQMIIQNPDYIEFVHNEYTDKTNTLIETFINTAKDEGMISNELANDFIIRIFELYKRDISSPNSVLMRNPDNIEEHEAILNTLLYGIANKHTTD